MLSAMIVMLFIMASAVASQTSDCEHVADVSCGMFACALLRDDGTAVAWGGDCFGGDASNVDLTNVAHIDCGRLSCVAIKNDGTAEAWGDDRYGGDPTCAEAAPGCVPLPTGVVLDNIADASCGHHGCVALKNDGTTVWWGTNPAIAMPPTLDNIAAIKYSTGSTVAALTNDGTVVVWGSSCCGGDAGDADVTNVADVSCGGYACAARKNDDTVVVWGHDSYGADPGDIVLDNVADVSCGDSACVILKKDATAYAWGSAAKGGTVPAEADLTNVARVSCGEKECFAIKLDGTAEVWGFPGTGFYGDNHLTNVADIALGSYSGTVRYNNGTTFTWGHSDYGGDSSSVAPLEWDTHSSDCLPPPAPPGCDDPMQHIGRGNTCLPPPPGPPPQSYVVSGFDTLPPTVEQ